MVLPVPKVEIAFSTQPDDPSPAWVDVTVYTRNVTDNISITRGRQDKYSTVQPSTLGLTLLNKDGRFTPGNINSPFYPNVKKGRKIRVSVTYAGVTYTRFTGYVDEWPVEWPDASAVFADAKITATSRMARLGRGQILRSIVEVEYLNDSPVAYYPLGDAAGSLNAGNVSDSPQSQLAVTPFGGGSNGNITFGSTTGAAPTSTLTAALFTRVSATAGAYLTAPVNNFTSGSDPSFMLEAWFLSSSTQEMGIVQLDDGTNSTLFLKVGTDSSGKLTAAYSTVSSGTVYTITSSATVTDGAIHHVALRQSTAGPTTGTLFLDGVSVGTATVSGSQNAMARVIAGGGLNTTSAFVGTIAHVAAYSGAAISNARVQQHYIAGSTGFSGERSDQRVTRLAQYAGIPSAQVTVETGLSVTIASQDTTDQIPITLMQDVTQTEGGVLFDSGAGNLVFHARSHRYNAASALTLDSEIMPSLTPTLDDTDLVNDVSASRGGGVSVRSVDTASVAEYGTYRQDIQLLTTNDNEVADAASWKVFTASVPQVRVPTAEADVGQAVTVQGTAILAREIGDRITLAGLPVQAPASSMDFFIEGWTETITDATHRIVFNLSNALLSGVWQMDSPVYSVMGSSTRLAY